MEQTSGIFWQCEQLRAGQVYNRMLFTSKSEAEEFMRKLRQAQPDMFVRLEAVAANAIWN